MQLDLVKKAVIPVAGLGTRMLPATKAIPKEMLPIVDKPLIQYVVQECVNAGIKEIILVTHASKNSIENHFDTSFELEATLENRVKRQLLAEVKAICPDDVTIMHVRQGVANGLGHAVLCAQPLVGDSPFCVVLPDVILAEYSADQKKENLAEMISNFEQTGNGQVLVSPVPRNEVDKYGIVDIGKKSIKPREVGSIKSMVEKPSIEDAPSNLSVVGRYVFSSSIWEELKRTPPGAGGEIQLTDAILTLLSNESIEAYHMSGISHDCGSKLGYMIANVEYAKQHHEIGDEFTAKYF